MSFHLADTWYASTSIATRWSLSFGTHIPSVRSGWLGSEQPHRRVRLVLLRRRDAPTGSSQSLTGHDLQENSERHVGRRRHGVRKRSRTPASSPAAVNITSLPRPQSVLADDPVGDEGGVRTEVVLRRRPVRVRPHRGAAVRRAQPRLEDHDLDASAVGRWLVTRDGFDFPRTTCPTTTTRRISTVPRSRATSRSSASTPPCRRCSTPPEAATRSSSATRSCSSRTTGNYRSSTRRGSRHGSRRTRARSSSPKTCAGQVYLLPDALVAGGCTRCALRRRAVRRGDLVAGGRRSGRPARGRRAALQSR